MGSNNLAARSDGQTVQAEDVNQYRNAAIGDQVPRNASGSAEASAGGLGTSSLPWKDVYFSGQLIQDGNVIDFSRLAAEGHQILSGAALSSGYPDFMGFVAASTTGRILATTVPLVTIINNSTVTVSANIDVTGLTLGPSSNHTCLINDSSLAAQETTRLLGENGLPLTVNTIGSAITDLNGTVQVFQKGSEYFLAYIDSGNNKLWPFRRGFAKTDRATLTNGDTITLVQGNYIFLDGNGSSTYKTTIFPTYSPTQPGSPVSNQWYFNTTSNRWERYSGSWTNMSAHWIGTVICDSSAAVASDSNDFNLSWGDELEGSAVLVDADTVRVILNRVNVAGKNLQARDYGQTIKLSVSGDRDSGVIETANTDYYIYADNTLKRRFSNIAPRYRDGRLGLYHPRQYWRYIATVRNDNSSNITSLTFDGNARTAIRTVTPYPTGYHGSAAPLWLTSSTFSLAYIRERDITDTYNITKNDLTAVDTATAGLNGLARSPANLTGTLSYTNASAAVVGTGTNFTAEYQAEDTMYDQTNGNAIGTVGTVNSATSITLKANFSGTSRTNVTHRRGAKVANSKWYLYAVSDGVTPGLMISNRNVAGGDTLVDLPNSGYTISRQLNFSFVLDASGNIYPIEVGEGWPNRPAIYFKDLEFDPRGASLTTALNGGTASSFTDVSLAPWVPANSQLPILRLAAVDSAGSGDDFAYFRRNGDTTNGIKVYAQQNFAGRTFERHHLACDSAQIVEYNCNGLSGVSAFIQVLGYVITEAA